MTTYKFFDQPKFHDKEFYEDREVSDHIHERGHRERLLRALSDISFVVLADDSCQSVSDLGCGNGGLLHEIRKLHPHLKLWGYDLSPKAIEDGSRKYGVDIQLRDFVNEPVSVGDIVLLTEVLEHLVEPEKLLRRLRGKSKWLVVSCPAIETPEKHYEYHLWAWTPDSFGEMFKNNGYTILFQHVFMAVNTQYLVAYNGASK